MATRRTSSRLRLSSSSRGPELVSGAQSVRDRVPSPLVVLEHGCQPLLVLGRTVAQRHGSRSRFVVVDNLKYNAPTHWAAEIELW